MIERSATQARGGVSAPHHWVSRSLAVAMGLIIIVMFGVLWLV